jgi:hypothetical protein
VGIELFLFLCEQKKGIDLGSYNNVSISKKFFSICSPNFLPSRSTLSDDQKDMMREHKRIYEETISKPPVFEEPVRGPNYNYIARRVNSQEEYAASVDKYKDKHSQSALFQDYQKKEMEHVVAQSVQNGIPEKEAKIFAKELKEEDQAGASADKPKVSKAEYEWRDDMDNESFPYTPTNLPEDDGRRLAGAYTPSMASHTLSPPSSSEESSASDENAQEESPAPEENAREESPAPEHPFPNPESSKDNNKRSLSSSDDEESKRRKVEDENSNKGSPLDYVIEKQQTEMPDIFESDGGE